MMFSEKEAKTKQCRAGGRWRGVRTPINDDLRWDFPLCSASECMHWRWHDEETAPPMRELKELEDSYRRGFCGLAGRP